VLVDKTAGFPEVCSLGARDVIRNSGVDPDWEQEIPCSDLGWAAQPGLTPDGPDLPGSYDEKGWQGVGWPPIRPAMAVVGRCWSLKLVGEAQGPKALQTKSRCGVGRRIPRRGLALPSPTRPFGNQWHLPTRLVLGTVSRTLLVPCLYLDWMATGAEHDDETKHPDAQTIHIFYSVAVGLAAAYRPTVTESMALITLHNSMSN